MAEPEPAPDRPPAPPAPRGDEPPALRAEPPASRGEAREWYRNFFTMLQPRRVRADSLRLRATWGLGLAAAALFAIVALTGILLMVHYVPDTDPQSGAYASMQELRYAVPFGRLMRNMHLWSAHLMVVVVALHMARAFFTGAFKAPRQVNWLIGVLLLVLTLGESFTGYLLPWDQLSYWAVEVGMSILAAVPVIGDRLRSLVLGGPEIGQTALVRFYGLHVLVLPLAMAVLIVTHLWRVRQDGGLAHADENLPPADRPVPELRHAWPHLVLREAVVLLLCLGLVTFLAARSDLAPLGESANPLHAPEPVKAAWYFLWLQELVSYDYGFLTRLRWPPWNADGPTLGSEFWGGLVVPAALLVWLAAVPFIRPRTSGLGVYWARGRRLSCTVFMLIMLTILGLTLVGYYLRGPGWELLWPK